MRTSAEPAEILTLLSYENYMKLGWGQIHFHSTVLYDMVTKEEHFKVDVNFYKYSE